MVGKRKKVKDVPGFFQVGRILHLEHFNHRVPDQDTATVFFMNGLGLTRDPYQRTDETNMGVNVGFQQLHLPRDGETHRFDGVIGLVVPDLPVIKARLKMLRDKKKFKNTPYRYKELTKKSALVTSPFGTNFRLHQAGSIPFNKPLGMPYIELMIPLGKAKGIVNFYQKVMDSPARLRKAGGQTVAEVVMGPYQHCRFVEKELDSYDLFSFHIAIFVSHFDDTHERLSDLGVEFLTVRDHLRFWDKMVDPDTGEHLLTLMHETRSIYHPDFMHAYTNRWQMNHDPFAHQAYAANYLMKNLGRV